MAEEDYYVAILNFAGFHYFFTGLGRELYSGLKDTLEQGACGKVVAEVFGVSNELLEKAEEGTTMRDITEMLNKRGGPDDIQKMLEDLCLSGIKPIEV